MGTTDTYNGGVNCHNSAGGRPKQAFIGWMIYNRFWFHKDLYAITLGGGQMNNPGRYLTLLPPINGATAISGTPYFTENAGDRAQMHDGTITFDYMPSQFITFRLSQATATPIYLTGPAAAASRLPEATTALPRNTPAPAGDASGYGYGTPLTTVNQACGGSSNPGIPAQSGGPTCAPTRP